MKLVTGIVTSLLIGAVSFGAMAAKELEKSKVKDMNLTKVGTIVTDSTSSPMDAKHDLSKKADELGGKYFVVTSGEKYTKDVHATADVYK
ncbi:YdgH/BhsA/McbA-like domain containing protein [Dryocola sp. BD626]|uniref:YdgH/BhsA/McbA-like domain containing protein n=1 Tax=Dryocola sp. BD626 TaxID=3133273 RepID=UPI003F5047DB